MFSVPRPEHNDADIFDHCIRHRKKLQVKSTLTELAPAVRSAYTTYHSASGNPQQLVPLQCSEEAQDALRGNFGLLDKGSPLAHHRDALMAGPDTDKCPMCGCYNADTLDHYLPQSKFPEFSVLSANLVPACNTCNRLKGAQCNADPGSRFLHAYFDVLPKESVLAVRVRVTEEAVAFHFEPAKLPSMSAGFFQILRFHFDALHLPLHFAREANDELGGRSVALQVWFDEYKAPGVSRYFKIEADSVQHQHGVHHWKTALFRSLQDSQEFCNGGFQRLWTRNSRRAPAP